MWQERISRRQLDPAQRPWREVFLSGGVPACGRRRCEKPLVHPAAPSTPLVPGKITVQRGSFRFFTGKQAPRGPEGSRYVVC